MFAFTLEGVSTVSVVYAPVRAISLCCVVTFCAAVPDAKRSKIIEERRIKETCTSLLTLSVNTRFSLVTSSFGKGQWGRLVAIC